MRPSSEDHVKQKQADQKSNRDRHAREQGFEDGQAVMVQTFRPGLEWVPGEDMSTI